jgi:hypothetical protein
VLVLVFTVLVSVLMVMAPGVGAMVVSMCMYVLMFVAVSLSRFVHVFMAVEMLMRMRAFHEWCSFQKNLFSYIPLFLEPWNTGRCTDCPTQVIKDGKVFYCDSFQVTDQNERDRTSKDFIGRGLF